VEITNTDYRKSTQNSCSSKLRKLHFGIPQGSILGRVLFLLYINDLTTFIKDVKMVLYADDTNILVTNKNKVFKHKIKHGYDAVRGMVIKE
jgi:hypothetical protein